MRKQNSTSQFFLSPNRPVKGKILLSLEAHRRLKSLNKSLEGSLPISIKLKRELAKEIGVPSCLIKTTIVNTKSIKL